MKPVSCFITLLALVLDLSAAQKRPNIVFIFRTIMPIRRSAPGSKINQTPNIDRIANAGMRFDRALVCNSIWSQPVAILTGKYSHANGFFRNGNLFDGLGRPFPNYCRRSDTRLRSSASGT